METYDQGGTVREELFANHVSLDPVEVIAVSCCKLVVSWPPLSCQSVCSVVSCMLGLAQDLATDCSFQPWSRIPDTLCIHSSTSCASAHVLQLSVVPARLSCRSSNLGGAPGSTGLI